MMQNKGAISIIGLLFLLLVLAEIYKPRPIDWKETYTKEDKIPYGNKILYDLLPNIFPNQQIKTITQPLYNELKEQENLQSTNYILQSKYFVFDELDSEVLLNYVARGNHVFITSKNFGILGDTLGAKLNFHYVQSVKDTSVFGFVHPDLGKEKYHYSNINSHYFFSSFDATNSQILAVNNHNNPIFIQTKYGKGNFYLHANPKIFSNYHMLKKNNSTYIAKALSHLPLGTVFWDEYYKVGRKENTQTPLRYILSIPALRWALYLSLGSIFLFIFFEGKRKQRIIPIVQPLRNTSVEFTKTLGSLYYKNRDDKNIAEKKILYFSDYLRSKYFIRQLDFKEDFYKQIAQKSGVPLEKVQVLLKQIYHIRQKEYISDIDLKLLAKRIDFFYQQTK